MNERTLTLEKQIKKLQEAARFHERQLEKKDQIIKNKDNIISVLEHRLTQRLIEKFGRKSEKFIPEQYGLFDEPLSVKEEPEQEDNETVIIPNHTRKKRGRAKLPTHLPREIIEHDLSDEEKFCGCGDALHCIGQDKAEQLEYIPAQYKVIEHITYKYACQRCEDGVQSAERPGSLIPKSIATPGLCAHIIVAKYCDHLPLYRQEKIFERHQLSLARGTLGNWIIKLGELCTPLKEVLKSELVSSSYIQADETPVRILKLPDNLKPPQGYMWVARGGPPGKPCIYYEFHPSRSGEAAKRFLAGFSGKLQTDAYQGYNHFRLRQDIHMFACMAHARRKFMDIVKANREDGLATSAVNIIRKLYRIEDMAREQKLSPELRAQLRQREAKVIVTELKNWLEQNYSQVPPQSPIGKAIAYSLNHWELLKKYVDDGEVEIDNNLVENAIRPFALGRRNWLFVGNQQGADAGAFFYSLIETCRLHSIEPYAYLKYLFAQLRLIDHSNLDHLRQLLPQYINPHLLKQAYSNSFC